MNDKINEIRFALRSIISEEIQEQAIIAFYAVPASEDKSEYESFINIVGFDKALSRGTAGFGGGTPTSGASHGDSPSLEKTEEDVGAWKVLGLPDRTATGMNAPSPWIVFMDWFWDFLKSAGMNPMPAKNFGEVTKPYSQLSPGQKRQRKYGVQHKPGEEPDREISKLVAQMPERQDVKKTKSLSGAGHLWPAGFDIKRYVSVVTSSLGGDQEDVAHRFRSIMAKAKPDQWFRIAENRELGLFFVYINIDAEMPEGWRDRLSSLQIYHAKRKAEWEDLLRDFSERRANVAQLRPLLARYMIDKQKFTKPFNIDVLNDEEYARAKQVLQGLKLADIVSFAKEIGVAPPVVGLMARGAPTPKSESFNKLWDDVIERLAAMGPVDPLIADVALSNWMSAHGFPDPFDFESLPGDKKLKAIVTASKLTFNDIRDMMESAQAQIKALLG